MLPLFRFLGLKACLLILRGPVVAARSASPCPGNRWPAPSFPFPALRSWAGPTKPHTGPAKPCSCRARLPSPLSLPPRPHLSAGSSSSRRNRIGSRRRGVRCVHVVSPCRVLQANCPIKADLSPCRTRFSHRQPPFARAAAADTFCCFTVVPRPLPSLASRTTEPSRRALGRPRFL